tara:strand:+ start:393 stop:1061 length:669 start_codon:yes stop_codon:yes gene_type:complete
LRLPTNKRKKEYIVPPDDHISPKSSPISAGENTPPTRSEAEEAVRILIKWMGDDPTREGLIDTPKRVINSYGELFSGYTQDPREILERTFEETDGYGDIVLLKDIRVESYCEHHLIPITGVAHVAYIPENRVVGISKLARTVELFSKRLQIQEKLTSQVANAINDTLKPKGVAVLIEAEHGCMTTRGVHKPGVNMVTKTLIGCFKENPDLRTEFLSLIKKPA